MFFQLVITILALTLEGQAYAAEIYGGREAVPHSRPYMVLLEENVTGGKKKYCDGFLLNEDFVMTAAHCQAESYTVLLGLHNIRDTANVQRILVEEKFPHKDYDDKLLINDIMLLKLKTKAHFSNNVKPISLPDEDDGTLPQSCIISGWGRSDRNSKYLSDTLKEANVTLIDDKECAMKNLYCSEGQSGPGKGDSGGPLVCEDGKAYGVVSYTSSEPFQHCYTKIPENRRWINLLMKTA